MAIFTAESSRFSGFDVVAEALSPIKSRLIKGPISDRVQPNKAKQNSSSGKCVQFTFLLRKGAAHLCRLFCIGR